MYMYKAVSQIKKKTTKYYMPHTCTIVHVLAHVHVQLYMYISTLVVRYSKLWRTRCVPSSEPHPLPLRTGLVDFDATRLGRAWSNMTLVCIRGISSTSSILRNQGRINWRMT